MNKCPHCQVTANPLRLVGDPPYICPKCGGHSTNAESRTEILKVVTACITAAAGGLLYEYVGFIRNHTFLLVSFSRGFCCFGPSGVCRLWQNRTRSGLTEPCTGSSVGQKVVTVAPSGLRGFFRLRRP